MRTAHASLPLAMALIAGAALPAPGRADFFTTGSGKLGDFSLDLNYTPISATQATLTATLKNTSPAGNGGDLTALVFNNPNGDISGASLTSTNANFQLLGATQFDNGVNGGPYGQFDIGASTFKSFEGGGDPAKGIGVNESATFTFSLTGAQLDTLDEESFVNTLSVPPGNGEGDKWFVARFRGFLDGGSDKVFASSIDPPPSGAPEPAALTLGAVGVVAFLGGAWRRRMTVMVP